MFLPFTGAVMFGVALGSCLVYVPLLVLLCLILAAILLTTGERWGRLTAGEGALLYGALLGGVLLWVAGVYQFTPWKMACLGVCRSPLAFLMQRWRAGAIELKCRRCKRRVVLEVPPPRGEVPRVS